MATKKKAPVKKKSAVKSLVKAALARFDSYAGPDETPPAPPAPKATGKKAKCKGTCSTCTTCNDSKLSGPEAHVDLTGATRLTDPDDKELLFDIYRLADGSVITRLRGPMPSCAAKCNIVCMLYATNKLLAEQLNHAAAIFNKLGVGKQA